MQTCAYFAAIAMALWIRGEARHARDFQFGQAALKAHFHGLVIAVSYVPQRPPRPTAGAVWCSAGSSMKRSDRSFGFIQSVEARCAACSCSSFSTLFSEPSLGAAHVKLKLSATNSSAFKAASPEQFAPGGLPSKCLLLCLRPASKLGGFSGCWQPLHLDLDFRL